MKSTSIKLSLTEDIKNLVRITSKYPYDIDLKSGRYLIDAKSILGIFSLDLLLIFSDVQALTVRRAVVGSLILP
jgi:hypothetical protein